VNRTIKGVLVGGAVGAVVAGIQTATSDVEEEAATE